MGNRFNYRCPKCGSPDEIEICAFISVRPTSNGVEITNDVKDIDGSRWSAENAAGCEACGFEGVVTDFVPSSPAGVISLNEYRRRR